MWKVTLGYDNIIQDVWVGQCEWNWCKVKS